jgi:nucleoside phosphorylase
VGSSEKIKSHFLARPNPISILDTKTHALARKFVINGLPNETQIQRQLERASGGLHKSMNSFICPVGSGSAVVSNDEIIGQIRGLNDSIWAVDMESYGFYHAAKYTNVAKPEFLCVKAVSDYCNGEKGDDYHDSCSLFSAHACMHIIQDLWDFK